MKANEVTLNSFLSQAKTQFVIPVYQRNYDWTEDQCRQLFSDIIEVGKKQGGTHFIGSIVFIHEGVYTSSEVRQLVVIDGQQRLTTFALLYLALYKYAKENGLEEKADELNDTFLTNKYVKEENSKLKLKQSDTNAKALKFLATNNNPKDYGEYSNVINNFNFFKQNINEDNIQTIFNGLNSLLFVEISLERGKDDPQRIFESLNSTGLELSQADLIRNYILMGLEPLEQIKIFENYWEIIESNAKDYSKEESRVSDFIRDYLTYKIKKIPNKTAVYEEFKLRYPERNNKFYNETIKELKEFSIFYHKLINPTKEEDSEISKELNFINRLEINVSYPFLLPAYNDYANNIIDKTTLVNILRLIQSYTWRRFIQDLPTSTINKIFLNLYSDINTNNYYESLEKALVKKKNRQRFPTNGEIEVTLALKDVYNTKSKNTVYLLELLENFNNREYVSIENPDITIEHIYPQNPDAKWYDMLEENSIKEIEDKYLHTISNLTLSGNNGSLGNKTFADKKFLNKDNRQQGYIYSRLWLNQYLKEIDEWNLDTLQKRYKILYDRFIQIWKYPDVILEDEEVENDEDYNIFNAPDPRHRKLDYFIFKDEKIITDEVAKMYYHVVSNLFDENSSAFNHPDLKNLLFLSTNPSDLRSPYKLNSSYYIEANIDNNTKFKKLKTLLTKFDCEEELLINFSNNDMTELDSAVKDRSYWDEKSSKESLFILDECLELMHEFEPLINYNYTQSYIGISIENKIQNFVIFVPKKSFIRLAIYIEDSALWINRLEEVGFKVISVGKKSGKIRFRITRENIQKNMAFLRDLFLNSYKNWQK
ncbi:MAG: DUF262 domain-containing protein [Saprospiraceae bacterium]|nr:DUF262 domain-containing protein [Candidatus Vicinibacter affinis]